MPLKPGDTYYGEFTTCRFDTGAVVDADSTPVATATKNGVDDAAFTLAVAKLDTGRYKLTGTVPAGYAGGNQVQISVAATVNSVSGKAVIDGFVIDSKRVGDLNDVSVAGVRAEMDANSTKLANLDAAVSSRLASVSYTAAPTGATIAAMILATPANKLVTDGTGRVTVGTNADKSGYDLTTAPPTAVQVRQEMDSNSAKLANLDATVSSRLASTSYTTAPNVSAIRAEMDANSTRLANLTGPVALASQIPPGFTSGTFSADGVFSADALANTPTAAAAPTPAEMWSYGSRALTDKSGFELAPTGLDSIDVAEPTGRPTTFGKFLVWLFMRFANEADRTTTTLKVKKSDGTTATSQAITDDGHGNETQGTAT